MKTCKECGELKPITDFYSAHGGKYAHTYCKKCSHKKTAIWNMEHRRVSKDARQKNKSYDHHNKVHMIVYNALRRGKLTKQPCIVCGTSEKINAHHEDYSKPLEVVWYCYAHHMQLHSDKRRELGQTKAPG